MPRGRHRHSPPLHRLLPPSAIAGVSVACALGPWAFSEAAVLRALAAAAAATAVVGAVVMRRWDTQAGRRVAELTRARAGDEWRHEERVAELETDLEESRALRAKLEERLRAKRAELARLRNEHAALLRRYATAETERASALEGRRLLELGAAEPESRPGASSPLALPPARGAEPAASPEAAGEVPGKEPAARAVFSPDGARLYRNALLALARFDRDTAAGLSEARTTQAPEPEAEKTADPEVNAPEASAPDADAADTGAPGAGGPEAEAPARGVVPDGSAGKGEGAADGVTRGTGAGPAAEPTRPVGQPAAGHYTVPAAVAVVPPVPARRPVVKGGFDFFGNQKDEPKPPADSVQSEDLADVVGSEAIAVHKAESESKSQAGSEPEAESEAGSEAGAEPVGEGSPEAGRVIDLTAHDETEQIDVQTLRGAAS
ncbi:hypothetical protein ACFY8B_10650 [Streptomyces sp. NPDC012751]|uniref:hypothetical protein n=1 Tax=Streptomyces sp. NPDC012751 TaxID=3364846 RepID=UPI0036787677